MSTCLQQLNLLIFATNLQASQQRRKKQTAQCSLVMHHKCALHSIFILWSEQCWVQAANMTLTMCHAEHILIEASLLSGVWLTLWSTSVFTQFSLPSFLIYCDKEEWYTYFTDKHRSGIIVALPNPSVVSWIITSNFMSTTDSLEWIHYSRSWASSINSSSHLFYNLLAVWAWNATRFRFLGVSSYQRVHQLHLQIC